VFVPEKNKMPKATDFANGPAKVFFYTNIIIIKKIKIKSCCQQIEL